MNNLLLFIVFSGMTILNKNCFSQYENINIKYELYIEEINTTKQKLNVILILTNESDSSIFISQCFRFNETSSEKNKIDFGYEKNKVINYFIRNHSIIAEEDNDCIIKLLPRERIEERINLCSLYIDVFEYLDSELSIFSTINLFIKKGNMPFDIMKLKSNSVTYQARR